MALAAGILTLANPPAAEAVTVNWQGQGAPGGVCESFENDDNLNPGPGEQGWLFILTSPDTGPWQLTATFDTGTESASGVQRGNGAVHFHVITPEGAVLQSASATNGTELSVLTVSHCELGEDGEDAPTVQITKDCGEDTGGSFTFSISPNGFGSPVLACDGTSETITLVAGTEYTITETVPMGWTATSASCTGVTDTTPGTDSVTFTPEAGDTVLCTFVNEMEAGEEAPTVQITKDCGEDTGGSFTFSISPNGFGSPVLACDGTSETITLVAGTEYTITETVPMGWTATSASCTGVTDTTPGTDSVTFTPEAGDTVLCTFVNEMEAGEEGATLTVLKDCGDFVGTGPTFTFLIDGSPVDGLTATCTAGSETINIDPGVDFILSEDLPDDWNFVSVNCDAGGPEPEGDTGVELNANQGDDITCTFVNEFVSEVGDTTLTVLKDCGDFAGTGPTFTFLIDGSPVDGLTATCTAGSETINIDPGVDFILSEDLPDDWNFVSVNCDAGGPEPEGDTGVELNANQGDDITCTFVNEFVGEVEGPSLTVEKECIGGVSTTFTFLIDDEAVDGLTATCEAGSETIDVEAGVPFTLTEQDIDGWNLTGIDCGDADATPSNGGVIITPAEGEDILCIVTNEAEGDAVASIVISKDCVGEDDEGDDTTFTFFVDGQAQDGLTATCDAPSETINLVAGTYDITEDLSGIGFEDWAFGGASCSGADFSAIDLGVSIDLEPGDEASCTFINVLEEEEVEEPTLVINKLCLGGSGETFNFDLNGETITATCETDSEGMTLEVDDFLLTEDMPLEEGWDLISVSCTGIDETPSGDGVSFSVGAEDGLIVCTFINEFVDEEAVSPEGPEGPEDENGVIITSPSPPQQDIVSQVQPQGVTPQQPQDLVSEVGGVSVTPDEDVSIVSAEGVPSPPRSSITSEIGGVRRLPTTGTGGPDSGNSPPWVLIASVVMVGAIAGASLLWERARR